MINLEGIVVGGWKKERILCLPKEIGGRPSLQLQTGMAYARQRSGFTFVAASPC
jgi:hypothetical protein